MNVEPIATPLTKERYRAELIEWITHGLSDHDLFVTHAFNRTIKDYTYLKKSTLELWKRLDKKALGQSFKKKPALRANGIFFAEHLSSNTHVHGILKAPYLWGKGDWGIAITDHIASRIWKWKLVQSGTFDIAAITDREGLAEYVTKEYRRGDFQEGYFLASELWPSEEAG